MRKFKSRLYREKCLFIEFTSIIDDEFNVENIQNEEIEIFRNSNSQNRSSESIERISIANEEILENNTIIPSQKSNLSLAQEELVKKNNRIQKTIEE